MKAKRRRSAASSSLMLRSAVFIVPTMYTFGGTENGSPLWGSTTVVPRLSSSSRVISSPKILGMLPRLISSMRRRYRYPGDAPPSDRRA